MLKFASFGYHTCLSISGPSYSHIYIHLQSNRNGILWSQSFLLQSICIVEIVPKISVQKELSLLHYVIYFVMEMTQEMIGLIFIYLPNGKASRYKSSSLTQISDYFPQNKYCTPRSFNFFTRRFSST